MEAADGDRPLAEEAQGDPAVRAVLRGEGDAGRQRDVSPDDAVAAEHVGGRVEHVHRAAQPLRAASLLAPQLGHERVRGHPLGDGDAVIAVGGDHVVVRLERGDGPDADRLLPDVQVKEPADLPLGVGARGLLFEAANQEHLPVEPRQVVERCARPRRRRHRARGRFGARCARGDGGDRRGGRVGRRLGGGGGGGVRGSFSHRGGKCSATRRVRGAANDRGGPVRASRYLGRAPG